MNRVYDPPKSDWTFDEKVEWLKRHSEIEPNTSCWLWLRGGAPFNPRYDYAAMTNPNKKGECLCVGRWLLDIADDPKLEACHKCDTPACVNPSHFFVGTHHENFLDAKRKNRIGSGERHGLTSLTQGQVDEVRERLEGGELGYLLAKEFGVSKQTISNIKNGRTWAASKQEA